MDEVAAAREISSRLRAAAEDVHSRRLRPPALAAELAGLAERVDGLTAKLERRLARAGGCGPSSSDRGQPDSGLINEGLSLLEDFRLIPRPELRQSVLALVHALSPDASRAAGPNEAAD